MAHKNKGHKLRYIVIALTALYFILRSIFSGMNYALCNTSLLIIIIYLIYKGRKEKKLINPYYLFVLTPFSLFVYDHTLSETFFLKLDYTTVWFAILNMSSFVLALNMTKKTLVFKDEFLSSRHSLLANGWFMFILSLCGSLIPPLASILGLFFYPAMACIIKTKDKSNIALMMAIWFLLNMNFLNKTTFLAVVMLLFLCMQSYYNVKLFSKKMIVGFILAALGMYIMFDLKMYLADGGSFVDFFTENGGSENIGSEVLSYYGDRVDWSMSAGLLLPYMYLTTAWTNVQYVIDTQNFHTYGLWFFKPLLGWLQVDDIFEPSYQLEAMTSFNTFTYLTVIYKDFGYYGSILVSFFLGYFVKRIYNDYCASKSPLVLGCYSCCALATLEMFFSNHFFGQSYPFTIVIVCFAYRLCARAILKNRPASIKTS